jgi:hypothetical protein
MEERIKLLEAQVTVLTGNLNKLDQVLSVVLQYMMINKTFFDGLQVNKPAEPPKEKAD